MSSTTNQKIIFLDRIPFDIELMTAAFRKTWIIVFIIIHCKIVNEL